MKIAIPIDHSHHNSSRTAARCSRCRLSVARTCWRGFSVGCCTGKHACWVDQSFTPHAL